MIFKAYQGDSRDVLRSIPDNSVDSVVTDPPYALVSIGKRFGAEGAAPPKFGTNGAYARASRGFMGQTWDNGETAFDPAFWFEVLRVLKPGGFLVAFGGTRTYHRLATAIEDAGFDIRDMIAWLYGNGFPKSLDVERAVAMQTCDLAGRHFSRNLPGEGERQDGDHLCPPTPESSPHAGKGTALKPSQEPILLARKPLPSTIGENAVAWGTGGLNIDACRIESEGGGDRREGEPSASRRYTERGSVTYAMTPGPRGGDERGRWPANVIHDGSDGVLAGFPHSVSGSRAAGVRSGMGYHGASGDGGPALAGSAARFFYCAKATTKDRMGFDHPTVKPIALLRYLVRLVTPAGGVVLDPFAGTGTTGQAAFLEGRGYVLIEREQGYFENLQARMKAIRPARGRINLAARRAS